MWNSASKNEYEELPNRLNSFWELLEFEIALICTITYQKFNEF